MAISDDFVIDYANKRIYHTGSSTVVYGVNSLYTYLMNTFDELDQLDDTIPMSAQTPTEYTMINAWFIDDESVKFLASGSIRTSGYSGSLQLISLNTGGTVPQTASIGLYVTDGLNNSGTLLHYDNTRRKWWVRRKTASDTFPNNGASLTVVGGTGAGTQNGASITGEDLFANIYTLGTIATDPAPLVYIFQSGSRINSWWGSNHIDVLVKVREFGAEIDEAKISVYAQHYQDLYDHFDIDLTAGGRNAVPLATATDLNNTSGEIYLSSSTSLASFDSRNFVRGQTSNAYGEIVSADTALNRLYLGNVRGNFSTAETIAETTNGLVSGDTGTTATLKVANFSTNVVAGYNDITIAFMNMTASHNGITGSFSSYERLTWTNGSGTFLSSSGAPLNLLWIGSVSGTRPTSGLGVTGSTSAAHTGLTTNAGVSGTLYKAFTQQSPNPYNVFINSANRPLSQVYEYLKFATREGQASSGALAFPVFSSTSGIKDFEALDGEEYITAYTDRNNSINTYSPSKQSPYGTFAGGTFFGARGVWIEGMAPADIQSFQLTDADGNTRTPPNFITLTVGNVTGSDRVAVFLANASGLVDKLQYQISSAFSASTTLYITGTIPSDTPNSGSIRVSLSVSGSEQRYSYSAWSGNAFTIPAGLNFTYRSGSSPDKCYVPYIDELVAASATAASVTVIYVADRDVIVRVRRYNGSGDSLLPFETSADVVSTGMSVTAIRTSDSIVG